MSALGGASQCDNDDCDRDGDADADDVECAAGCIFGICPVPPHAPHVVSVTAETALQLVATSVATIDAENLGGADDFRVVFVNETLALVLEYVAPDRLRVLVPAIEPGPAQVVVRRGTVDSAPFAVIIAEPSPIGSTDGLQDLATLAEDLLAETTELDLDAIYGQDASIILEEVQGVRSDFANNIDSVLDAPEFDPDVRGQIDAAVDASGIPEQLRAILAESLPGAASPGDSVERMRELAGGLDTAGALTEELGRAHDLQPLRNAGRRLAFGSVLRRALGFRLRLRRVLPDEPEPGSEVEVLGDRLDLSVDLLIETAGREEPWRVPALSATQAGLLYRLPRGVGFCGPADFFLADGEERSNGLQIRLRPVILGLDRTFVDILARDVLTITVDGVLGCLQSSAVGLNRTSETCKVRLIGTEVIFPVANDPEKVEVRLPNPLLPPDRYDFRLAVDFVALSEPRRLDLGTPVGGIMVRCAKNPVSLGTETTCSLTATNPETIPESDEDDLVNVPTFRSSRFSTFFPNCAREVAWSASNDAAIITLREDPISISLRGEKLGTTELSARFETDEGAFVARTTEPFEVKVVDDTKPAVTIIGLLSPSCPSFPCPIARGTEIRVRVRATDEDAVNTIGIRADPTSAFSARIQPCLAQGFPPDFTTCEETVSATLSADFPESSFGVFGIASDVSGNDGVSEEALQFAVEPDQSGGTIRGAVRRADDQTGLGGAAVELLTSGDSLIATTVRGSGATLPDLIATTTTAADGSFGFDDILPGGYLVRASAPQFRNAEQAVVVESGKITDVILLLQPGTGETASRFGTVTEAVGRDPVSGATVTALNEALEIVSAATTGGNGAYGIDVPIGEYLLEVSAPGRATSSVRLRSFTAEARERNFTLALANPECSSELDKFDIFRAPVSSGKP